MHSCVLDLCHMVMCVFVCLHKNQIICIQRNAQPNFPLGCFYWHSNRFKMLSGSPVMLFFFSFHWICSAPICVCVCFPINVSHCWAWPCPPFSPPGSVRPQSDWHYDYLMICMLSDLLVRENAERRGNAFTHDWTCTCTLLPTHTHKPTCRRHAADGLLDKHQ